MSGTEVAELTETKVRQWIERVIKALREADKATVSFDFDTDARHAEWIFARVMPRLIEIGLSASLVHYKHPVKDKDVTCPHDYDDGCARSGRRLDVAMK